MFESIIGLFEVGEEELSQWRESHRESMKRERGRGGGEGAESHEEVGTGIDQEIGLKMPQNS